MKDLLFTMFVIFSLSAAAYAQDRGPFYPMQSGTVLEYTSTNVSDQSKYHIVQTINYVLNNDSVPCFCYTIQLTDRKHKSLQKPFSLTSPVDGETVKVYPLNFIGSPAYGEIRVSGDGVQLPGQLRPGQKLGNGYVIINQGPVKTRVNISNRHIVAYEPVKVAAGKYPCFKIEETHETTYAGLCKRYTVYNWYAEGIGLVKSTTYDNARKCVSNQELVKVKGKK